MANGLAVGVCHPTYGRGPSHPPYHPSHRPYLPPPLQDEVLSDLSDDEDLGSYIATKEEAELKGLLWTEMNK